MNKVKLIETVVDVLSRPVHRLVGLAGGHRIVYKLASFPETSIWALDLESDDTAEIDEGNIGLAASSIESDWIIYEKTEGLKSTLYASRVSNGERVQIEGVGDYKVTGIAVSRKTAVATLSSPLDFKIAVISQDDWSVEALINVDKPVFVNSMQEPLAVGIGHLHGDPRSTELFIVDIDQGSFIDYTPRPGSNNRNPKISGRRILFSTALTVKEELLVLDYESMTCSRAETNKADHKEDDVVEYIDYGWIDGDKIWFIGLSRGSSRAYIDGKRLPSPEGYLVKGEWSGKSLIVEYTSFKTPNSIIAISDKKHKALVPHSHEAFEGVDEWSLKWVESSDGLRVPVWVVRPGANESGPRKAVIYVHGGPFRGVYNEWNPIVSLFASLGYNVVIPNYRGSRGFGEHYRRMLIGDPGRGDVHDVLSVAHWTRNSGLAERVAGLGFSYGAYLALMSALKDPGAFDAVAIGHAIVDWEHLYENGSVLLKRFIDILFEGRRDLMKNRTPKLLIDKLEQPLCIVQPYRDDLSPLEPILNMAAGLAKLGKEFELHIVSSAGHDVLGSPDAPDILAYMASFIEKTLNAE